MHKDEYVGWESEYVPVYSHSSSLFRQSDRAEVFQIVQSEMSWKEEVNV